MQKRLLQKATGRAVRFIGATTLVMLLAACTTEKPWWEGGQYQSQPRTRGNVSNDEGGYVETTPISPPGRGGTYVVKPHDTLFKVSRDQNIPIRSLIDANNLQPPYALQTGQRLTIPSARYHTVRQGDTVYSISRTYGVDMSTLTSTNHIPSPYTIKLGQRLQLPSKVNTQIASRDVESETLPAPRPVATTVTTPQHKGEVVVASTQPKAPLPAPPTPAGDFIWPAQGKILSSFGPKENGLHNDGINIAVPTGTPVKAAQSGVVAYAGNELKGYGNLLLVRHANGWMTAYAHNSKLLVKRGDTVVKGQTISLSGSTGSVTTPQIHFEIRKGAKAVDPAGVING